MLARSSLLLALLSSLAATSVGCSYGVDSYTITLPDTSKESNDPCAVVLDAGVSLDAAIALLGGKDDGGCLADFADGGAVGGSGGAAGAGGAASVGGFGGSAGGAAGAGGSGGNDVSGGGSGG